MSAAESTEIDPPSIAPEDLHERIESGEPISILDLRNRDEVEEWHVDGPTVDLVQTPAVNFVQAEVRGTVAEKAEELGVSSPVVVVCAEGEASAKIARLLDDAGIGAMNLAGGMEAWARLVVAREIRTDPLVVQYLRPSSGCVSYLIADGSEAVVVDPLQAAVDRYVADAEERGVEITHTIDTHVHADHFSGVRALAEKTGAEPVVPEKARDRGLAFDATLLSGGDRLVVGDAEIEAIHAPGHTSEMTALAVGDVLLTGDSLFLESVARPDLERGEEGARELAETLHATLQDLLERSDDTIVAAGHVGPHVQPAEDGTYTARLGDLRERLDLLGLDREEFVERILDDMPPRPANYERIIEANLGLRDVDDEDAFELELGPNNCAVS